jgi:hypothetical protein
MKGDVMTFKVNSHLRKHLETEAKKKDLKVGTYIKALLKKHTKYKEPELV